MRPIDALSPSTRTVRALRAPAPRPVEPSESVSLQALPLLETPKKAVTVLADTFGYAEFPQASPDGEHVLFNVVGDYETSQMIVMDADGGNKRALFTGEPVDADGLGDFLQRHHGRIDEQGTWTADGRSVYYRTNSEGPFSIARFDLERGRSRVVVSDPGMNMKHPVETVDGYILGYGGPPDEKIQTSEKYSDILLADPRTGNWRLLTHSDGSVSYKHPAEMEGRILAHAEPRGVEDARADVVAVDSSTGAVANLTATPDADERHPFYNAKVGLVAFHSDDTGDKNLWLATPDFQHRAQLTFYGKAAQSPSWSADGRKLYFVKKQAKQAEGEPFYKRQADIRVLDVKKALKDLVAQADDRVKDLSKQSAEESVVEAARQAAQEYRFFLERYA